MSAVGCSFVALALVTLTACATGHQAMNGSVIMKVSDTEAHVCLFDREVPVGTQVRLYRHGCAEPAGGPYRRPTACAKQQVAIGTIAQKIGDHYALVTFPQGTKYGEGYTIEPIP